MSLEDKFMPSDGSFINEFDNFMIKQAVKVGDLYQGHSGKSYKDLTKELHDASLGISLVSCLTLKLGSWISAGFSYGVRRSRDFMTPLQEQTSYEALGHNKHKGRYARLVLVGGSTMFLTMGAFHTGTEEQAIDLASASYFGNAVSWGLMAFAEYLSKANLPPPKKKTEKVEVLMLLENEAKGII